MKKLKCPKVSVIIPVYNGEKTLSQCLESVLNQGYKNYEIILVDNNSTDRTKKIIQKFQKKDGDKYKRIRYFFEPRIGRGAARNTGGRKAKGEIILMTDSDCIVPNNWIKEMIGPIIKRGFAAVQGIKRAKIINYWTMHKEQEEERHLKERIKDKKIGSLDTANFAIKRSVLKEIGHTNRDLIYGEDTELMVRLKIRGYDIYFKRVAVQHFHPETAFKIFNKLLKNAVWNQKIKKMYSSKKEMFPKQNIIGHLRYFFNIFFELLTLHDNLKYDFVTGLAWRVGSLYGAIR